MPKPKPPYTCIRCGYECQLKPDMRKHLLARKTPCQKLANDIELTGDVKTYILEHRVYRIPPKPESERPTSITQNINFYNTMNNFVSNIDTMKKLQDYVQYKNIALIPFEDSVEKKYEKTKEKLEHGQGLHTITHDDILDIVDSITKSKEPSMEDFNVIYDSQLNKIMLYETGDWKEMFLTTGCKTIIRTVQEYLWDAYECHLIRKVERNHMKPYEKQHIRELLEEYYTFLGCMDVDPYVKGKPDNQIMYNSDHEQYWKECKYTDIHGHDIADRYFKIYTNIKENITNKKRETVKNELVDLVKRNTKKNVADLNKLVMSLINIDPDYQKQLTGTQLPLVEVP